MYFIGTRPHANGCYFIHREDCPLLPLPGKRIYLGTFLSPDEAAAEGRKYFDNPGSCLFCLKGHHAKADIMKHAGIMFAWESVLLCGVN